MIMILLISASEREINMKQTRKPRPDLRKEELERLERFGSIDSNQQAPQGSADEIPD
jgi:hypothetical protein